MGILCYHIESEVINGGCKTKLQSRPIKGSDSFTMISYMPDGTMQSSCTDCCCPNCLVGHFFDCAYSSQSKSKSDSNFKCNDTKNDLFDDQIDDSFDERENVLFEVITPNSYIALNAFSHLEQFYVCKVLSLEIADQD